MAQTAATYPQTRTTESVSPENANNWTNPANIGADDGSEAQITAATYDSPDISYRLKGQNFGFALPAGSSIDGILVEIDRRSIVSGSGKDYRVQLLDETGALVGDNKASATVWPTTSTIASYGGATDKWNWTTVNEAKIEDVDFGVALSCQAQIANADIGVDFIRVTIYYSPPAQIDTASAADADRSIENAYSDLNVNFTEAMQTAAAVGGTLRTEISDDGGTSWYATTYRSGSGSQNGWKIRVARVLNNGDTIQIRYRTAAAGTTITAVDDGAECADSTVTATNNLTKRFAYLLKDKNNANIASTLVGYTFTDISGTWSTSTTTATGWIDVEYTGTGAVGSSQYVALRKPNASPTEFFAALFTVQ